MGIQTNLTNTLLICTLKLKIKKRNTLQRSLFIVGCLSLTFVIGQSQGDEWEFVRKKDAFTDDALMDLRHLNESFAGENGYIQLSEDGESFVTENGKPIRFWGIGGGNLSKSLSDSELAYFSRFLAKKGVNMIRFHGRIHSVTNDINEANQKEIAAIWRLVEAMKKEGIYTTISPFWSHFLKDIPASWNLDDYTGGEHTTYALLYFNPRFQEAFLNWLTQLYTTPNPSTGIALKDEPAVGLIQILNEDGVFFWTIDGVQPSLRQAMEVQFYGFVTKKYGSIENAYARWGTNGKLPMDNEQEGKLELYRIWLATQDKPECNVARLNDQMEFYYTAQRNFYKRAYDRLREIGCRQLINASNWKTADDGKLLDLERTTNAVADVLAVNRYYSTEHEGPYRGWRIQEGDVYVGRSVLFQPQKLPVNVKQFKGKPFVMTESSWPLPHTYTAEAAFLTSAYASLNGFDAYYWYSAGATGYADEKRTFHTADSTFAQGNYPIYKFNISHPGYLSTFPANALLYRKGYVSEGKEVLGQRSTLPELWAREPSVVTENGGFDPNRDAEASAKESESNLRNLAFLAGKVTIDITDKKQQSLISQKTLDTLIRPGKGIIKSSTGELEWNYKTGRCTVDAPRVKGVVGFLDQKGQYQFNHLKISANNPYGSILLVSLDDLPLTRSRKVLVQVNTKYHLTDYQETPFIWNSKGVSKKGFKVLKTGRLPWRAEATSAKISLTNPFLKYAVQLDVNGYQKGIQKMKKKGKDRTVTLPKDALYLILTDKNPMD